MLKDFFASLNASTGVKYVPAIESRYELEMHLLYRMCMSLIKKNVECACLHKDLALMKYVLIEFIVNPIEPLIVLLWYIHPHSYIQFITTIGLSNMSIKSLIHSFGPPII